MRRKREEYLRRTGVELGPGEDVELPDSSDLEDLDDEDEDEDGGDKLRGRPGMPELGGDLGRKGVRWNTPLEAGFKEDLELHSPSRAKLKQPRGPVLQKKVQLDKNGNVIKDKQDDAPIPPGTPVVIRKLVYKGERPE